MDKKKSLGKFTVAAAFVFSVVAISVASAAYTSALTIKSSATVKATKWKVMFKDLGPAQTGNDNGVTPTATEKTTPTIKGDTSIENYKVELKTPGDYVIYNFKIKNAGDFPAKIDKGFEMPTPTCTKGELGVDDDETNVCGNLTYTLNYVEEGVVGDPVSVDDAYDIGEEKEVQLKIYYNKNATTEQLPVDDVTVGNLNITIPFIQY